MISPSPQIVCIDCGGRCFLLTHPAEDGLWEEGDIVAYRCEDCRDRWDLVLTDDDDDDLRDDHHDNHPQDDHRGQPDS